MNIIEKEEVFKKYNRSHPSEMRPYIEGEPITFRVFNGDIPKVGGYVARCYRDHSNQWYVSEETFKKDYIEINSLSSLQEEQLDKKIKAFTEYLLNQ